jgi:hypothetical protein
MGRQKDDTQRDSTLRLQKEGPTVLSMEVCDDSMGRFACELESVR